MPTTWLDIIDTAVKIGLGALISGVATYSITRLSNKHENQKIFASRKFEMVRESANYLEMFNEHSHACSLVLTDVLKGNAESEKLHEAAKSLSKGLSCITKSITNMDLLAGEASVAKLDELRKQVIVLVNFVNNLGSKTLSQDDLSEYNKLIDSVAQLKSESTKLLSVEFNKSLI